MPKKMTQATKRKISRALKAYHRCARRHKCGRKKVSKRKKKTTKRFDPEDMTVGQMIRAQGKRLKRRYNLRSR